MHIGCVTVSQTVSLCHRLYHCVTDCVTVSQTVSLCHRMCHCVTDCVTVAQTLSLWHRLWLSCIRAKKVQLECSSTIYYMDLNFLWDEIFYRCSSICTNLQRFSHKSLRSIQCQTVYPNCLLPIHNYIRVFILVYTY